LLEVLVQEKSMSASHRTLKEKAFHEFEEFLIIAFYLWVVLGLLEVHKSMILAEHHIDFAYHGLAIINALALAKVMLVAREVGLGNKVNDAPLIYPTVVKSALFTLVLVFFKILEDSALGWYRGESFHQSIADIGGGTWKAILTFMLLGFVFLIPFVALGELRRVLGGGKLGKIFFHRDAERHVELRFTPPEKASPR
jgi:hypothetical protein